MRREQIEKSIAAKTLQLRRDRCPCGWPPPTNVVIKNAVGFGATIEFECPQCGRGLMLSQERETGD